VNWNARSASTRLLFRNLSFDQLRALVLDGELNETDWVQRDGEATWTEIGAVPELADAVPAFTFRRGGAVAAAEEDMDMTPMIDVVFQLLLFFMVISTFQVQKSIGFPDPGDSKKSPNIPVLGQLGRDRIVVSVSAQDELELLHYDQSGAAPRSEPVKREDLVRRFEQIGREQRKTSVIIRADDQARHETVVAVIDAANLASMEDIRIAQPVESLKEDASDNATPIGPERKEPRTVEEQ
jgi:biopolymer transport protein ExbD